SERSLGTIASIPHLAEKNNVKVLSLSFSETQNGKSSCDRVAAQSGLRGVSVYLARVTREKTEEKEKALAKKLQPNIAGISSYGHFEFDGKTVRTCKLHGIGEGRVYKGLEGYKREIEIILEGGFVPSKDNATADETSIKKGEEPRLCWTAYLTKKGKADEEPDDTDEICSRGEEIDYVNLLRHLDIGRHRIRPEKVNQYDLALQLFKRNLEDVQAHNNILAEVSEAVIDMTTGENHDSDEGWALKGKRKHVVYSKKAKKFAEKLFNLGDENERKIDPAEVERLMKEDDNIKPCERMNAQQIRSYFTALCKKKKEKKAKTVRPKKTVINEYADDDSENDWSDVSDNDEENIDDFGREQDDVIHD
ncbi:hypothetical protein PMAYCL1PPCAC_25956, partial [Pristionchus mayeri]